MRILLRLSVLALVIGNHMSTLDGTNEGHSYIGTAAERFRRENAWALVLNGSGPNIPMNQREDYHEAIKIKER